MLNLFSSNSLPVSKLIHLHMPGFNIFPNLEYTSYLQFVQNI